MICLAKSDDKHILQEGNLIKFLVHGRWFSHISQIIGVTEREFGKKAERIMQAYSSSVALVGVCKLQRICICICSEVSDFTDHE